MPAYLGRTTPKHLLLWFLLTSCYRLGKGYGFVIITIWKLYKTIIVGLMLYILIRHLLQIVDIWLKKSQTEPAESQPPFICAALPYYYKSDVGLLNKPMFFTHIAVPS